MALSKITADSLGANAVTANSLSNTAITTALGFTPANNTSAGITTALGYTPANKAGDTFTGNTTVTGKLTANNIVMDTAFSHRNILINGNFDFWQRATSGNHTGIWSYVSADRWGGHFDGGTVGTYSRSTDVPNTLSTYSMKVAGNTGGTSAYLDQRIEAANGRAALKAGAITISGWIKRSGSASASVSVNLITPTAIDNFSSYNTIGGCFTQNNTITGDGTASSSTLNLTSADTWYYFTVTDTSWATRTGIANGAQLYFALGGLSSTSNYYLFSQLQVEAGTVATPFELRPYGHEFHLCQRYYEVHDQQVYTTSGSPGTNYYYYWHMKATKRATPTVSASGYQVTSSGGQATTAYVYGNSGTYMRVDSITASAEL